MSTVIEINAGTGEATERPLTAAEKAQRDKDTAEHTAREQAAATEAAERAKAEQDWRAALAAATSVAQIRDVLLGTNLPAQAASRPVR